MDRITEGIVTVFIAIIGVAILSVLVSPKARTSQVIQATASGFGNDLGVAVSPVTGNQYAINLSYPNQGGVGFGGGFPQFYN
jgi:PRD1 phage membrane DNA delivery